VIFQRDRRMQTINEAPVDVGLFELQGLKPVAGRFFSRDHGEDMVLERPGAGEATQPSFILNESAARAMGFTRPGDAVGKTFAWVRWAQSPKSHIPQDQRSQVVGVVPDFTLGSIRTAITPTLYYVDPRMTQLLLVKLDGGQIPETLRAVDMLWNQTGHMRPGAYVFENRAVQELYRDVVTQGVAIAICAGLAILIACLGLFALAAYTTERRTKEIGVRKAMGADTADVVRLLLWQFTQPVLWANLIAWPAAFWAMDQWLRGFAYRVDLPPWLFLAASALAILIAWLTVGAQAFLVARAKPVAALRYE
jgi:putative ABC transport system permease protein